MKPEQELPKRKRWAWVKDKAWPWIRLWAWDKGGFVLAIWVGVTIVIWWLLEVPPVAEGPHTLYLLSALAQSLAAVLALVFTISLVVAQLSSRYSHRMLAGFFDIWTIGYILLFIAAVFLPFWLLAELSPTAVKVSLTLAAACLLFLVPYFLRFREKLDPEHMVAELQRKAEKQLERTGDEEPQQVATIDNFVMSAFVLKDYDTFNRGVQALAALALEAYELKKGQIGNAVLGRLINTGLATIEDPRAPLGVISALGEVGVQAAEKGLETAAWWAAYSLGEVGVRAAEKGLETAAWWAAYSLGEVGVHAAEKGLRDAAWRAAYSLGEVGVHAAEKGLGDAAGRAAVGLWSLGARATFHQRADLERRVIDSLRSLEKATGAELIRLAFSSALAFAFGDPAGLKEALQSFKESYEKQKGQPLSEG